MAKLVAPLFSFSASGALAKALVFFPWKGINAVRSYVVPANPKTAGQVTQRGHMTTAVQEWHDSSYSADDVTAWNRLANLATNSLSGFNRMVQEYIKEVLLGNVWERLDNLVTSNVSSSQFKVVVNKVAAGNAPTVRWGTSPTNMPNNRALADNGDGTWQETPDGLSADTLIYYTVDVGATGVDFSRLGIYTQRTNA